MFLYSRILVLQEYKFVVKKTDGQYVWEKFDGNVNRTFVVPDFALNFCIECDTFEKLVEAKVNSCSIFPKGLRIDKRRQALLPGQTSTVLFIPSALLLSFQFLLLFREKAETLHERKVNYGNGEKEF